MSQTQQSALEAAEALHLEAEGGKGWCVGITGNPKRRLAAVHAVELERGGYFWVRCSDELVARETEELLFREYGYQAIRGAPTMAEGMVFVYVYQVTRDTDQRT
jgi:hypothetical protein